MMSKETGNLRGRAMVRLACASPSSQRKAADKQRLLRVVPAEMIGAIFVQVADGLSYLHSKCLPTETLNHTTC